MADPMETLLRTVMVRGRAATPQVGDLLAGARQLRRRRHRRAAMAAVALLAAVAVTVPGVLLGLRNTAAPVPAATPTPQPTVSARTSLPDVGKVTGSWPTGGVGPIAAIAGYAFGVSDATNDARPPILRVGDDGVRSLQVAPASSPVGPSLITANATAVYALSQRPHYVAGPDRVWRIDPQAFTVTAGVAFPDRPFAAAASDRGLYVATSTAVYLLDPVSLRTLARYQVPGAQPEPVGNSAVFSVVSAGDNVYAAYGNALSARLLRLSPTLTLLGQTALPPGQGTALFGSACGAWLLAPDGRVRRIDGLTLGVAVAVPGTIASNPGGVVACDGLDLSTFEDSHTVLVHIDRTGRLTARQTMPSTTTNALAIDLRGPTLWTGGQDVMRLALPTAAGTASTHQATTPDPGPQGVLERVVQPFSSSNGLATNGWQRVIDGVEYEVLAGTDPDAHAGLIVIHPWVLEPGAIPRPVPSGWQLLPKPGAHTARITGESGSRLNTKDDLGRTYVFDIQTWSYVG